MKLPTDRRRRLFSLALVGVLAACGGEPAEESPPDESATLEPGATAPPDLAEVPDSVALMNPNEVEPSELAVVEGLPPAAADALMERRPFEDMQAVDAVLAEHLDQPARTEIYTLLWLPVSPNTATAEELLLIPGLEEPTRAIIEAGRPYADLVEFQQEVGQHLNAVELRRLVRYFDMEPESP